MYNFLPFLFLIMVNDLAITHNNRWKYVDVASLSKKISKGNQSHLQSVIDDTEEWYKENDMVLNHGNCKELTISFAIKKLRISVGCWLEDLAYPGFRRQNSLVFFLHLHDLRWNLHTE